MQLREPIVRAIDVGFGNTKYIRQHVSGMPPQCASFPSIAPVSTSDGRQGLGPMRSTDTIVVSVNGVNYQVGPDAMLSDPSQTRVLDTSFPDTDTYLALVRGALYYMGDQDIDIVADDPARAMAAALALQPFNRIPSPNFPAFPQPVYTPNPPPAPPNGTAGLTGPTGATTTIAPPPELEPAP